MRCQWKTYPLFCHRFSLTPLPTSPSTISCFLAYLSSKTTSFQYVMNHLNSVRLLHLYHGFACDALNSFPVALTKKGLKRIMGTTSQQKHPITIDILRQMRSVLDLAIPSQAALWCLFLVAFFSLLRKSNITAPSIQAFDPTKRLTRNDIKFSPHGALLRIRWSKTLQHREGILLIPLPSIPGSYLCPVAAIRQCPRIRTRPFSVYQKGNAFIPSPLLCSPAPSKPR